MRTLLKMGGAIVLVALSLVQSAQTWRLFHNASRVEEAEMEPASPNPHRPFLVAPDVARDEGQLAAHLHEIYRLSLKEIRDLLLSIPSRHLGSYEGLLVRAACERLGQLSGPEAAKVALAQFPEEMRRSVTGLIPLSSARADIQRLLQEKPSNDPQLGAYFKTLARQDPIKALELVLTLDVRDKYATRPYFETFFESFVASDPERAFEEARKLEGSERRIALTMAAEAWAEKDPKMALVGIVAHAEEGYGWATAMGTAIGSWAYEDLEGALRHFVEEFPELASNGSCLRSTTTSAAAHDAASLIEASRILPESVQASWLSMSIDSDSMPIEEAVAILEAIPPGRHHMSASHTIAKRMATDNWEGMLAWVDSLEYPESHDAALRRVAGVYYNDWDTMIGLFQRMHDPQAAQEEARHAFQHWKSRDPIGAEQWLETSQVVSPEMRKAISSH